MVVVLPAPLGPRKANTSPVCDLEVEPPDRLEVAVRLVQAGDRDIAALTEPIVWTPRSGPRREPAWGGRLRER